MNDESLMIICNGNHFMLIVSLLCSSKLAANLIIHETNHKNFKSQQMALVQC